MSHNLATNKIAQMLDICIAKFLASKETFDLSQPPAETSELWRAWVEECENGIGSVAEMFEEGTLKVHAYQAGKNTFQGFNIQFDNPRDPWVVFVEERNDGTFYAGDCVTPGKTVEETVQNLILEWILCCDFTATGINRSMP